MTEKRRQDNEVIYRLGDSYPDISRLDADNPKILRPQDNDPMERR